MEIRLRGQKTISEEIAEEYEKLIRFGALREGDKLPSCRALAMQLGINPNTAERAFAELERRGLVTPIPKKGVFVSASGGELLIKEARRQLAAIKKAGLTQEELISLVREIYGEERQ